MNTLHLLRLAHVISLLPHSFSGWAASPLDTVPEVSRWTTVTTDTGDLAPGHREFGRYTTVLQCLVAARTELEYQRHQLVRDTSLVVAHTTLETDTIPTRVAVVAQTCGSRFVVAATPAQDLPNLWKLELIARNDTAARAVQNRLEALQPSGRPRFTWMARQIEWLLHEEPEQVAVAESLVVRLAASGEPARDALVHVNREILEHFLWKQDGQHVMRTAAERHLALVPTLRPRVADDTDDWNFKPSDLWLACDALMQLDFYDHPDSLPALIQRIREAYQRPNVTLRRRDVISKGKEMIDPSSWTDAQIIQEFAPMHLTPDTDAETPKLPIHADFWFFGPHGGDSLPPSPGLVSFVVELSRDCLAYGDGGPETAGDCGEIAQDIQRIEHRLSARGLKITVVARTSGHAINSEPQSPEEEARTIAWYVQSYLHLPVTVAVQRTPVTRHPEPDGRVVETGVNEDRVTGSRGAKPWRWSGNSENGDYWVYKGKTAYYVALKSQGFHQVESMLEHMLRSDSPMKSTISQETP